MAAPADWPLSPAALAAAIRASISAKPSAKSSVKTRAPRHAGSTSRRRDGEFAFLAKVRAAVNAGGRARGVLVGIGDDCAVVEAPPRGAPLVLTTDTMVEGVHFRSGWLTPRELGTRAFRAAVSDIAAMGAKPRHVLLSLELPDERSGFANRDALAVVRAVAGESRAVGASLVGGNVSFSPTLAVTVTVIGAAPAKPLLRRGAKAGDLVFVTGRVGGAAAGWRALAAGVDPATPDGRAATVAYRRPPLRLDIAAELASRRLVHAMIDVSDGLLQDLGHLAEESAVSIRVDASSVPVHRAAVLYCGTSGRDTRAGRRNSSADARPSDDAEAARRSLNLALGGGEDYELAFTAPRSRLAGIEALAAKHGTTATVIGVVVRGPACVTDADGRAFAVGAQGFDHLRERATRKR